MVGLIVATAITINRTTAGITAGARMYVTVILTTVDRTTVVTTDTIDMVAITATMIDMLGIMPFVITIGDRRVIAASRSICAVI
jgi:hypothetical protein